MPAFALRDTYEWDRTGKHVFVNQSKSKDEHSDLSKSDFYMVLEKSCVKKYDPDDHVALRLKYENERPHHEECLNPAMALFSESVLVIAEQPFAISFNTDEEHFISSMMVCKTCGRAWAFYSVKPRVVIEKSGASIQWTGGQSTNSVTMFYPRAENRPLIRSIVLDYAEFKKFDARKLA